jgi:phospholipase/carboxylesterase
MAETALGLASGRDGLLRVPDAAGADPAPLVVAFHGAGGGADQMVRLLGPATDAAGVVLLAPESRDVTWDLLLNPAGEDVAFVRRALQATFERAPIDRRRIALAGFSDGASYALSAPVAEADAVIAFSPGFVSRDGRDCPRVFVSHGTDDRVLPVGRCGRRVVAELTAAGRDVTYHEFAGGHAVPPAVVERALAWLDWST